MKEKYHYLFGPLFSRRFGRPLGFDLASHATLAELEKWLKRDAL